MELSAAGVGNALVDFDDYCSRLFVYQSIPSTFESDPLVMQHLLTYLRVLEDISSFNNFVLWHDISHNNLIFWHNISDHDFVLWRDISDNNLVFLAGYS